MNDNKQEVTVITELRKTAVQNREESEKRGDILLTYIFSEKLELIINIKEKIMSVSKLRELTVDSKEGKAVVLFPWPQQLGWTVLQN